VGSFLQNWQERTISKARWVRFYKIGAHSPPQQGGFVFTILTRCRFVPEQTGDQLEPVGGGGAPGTCATLEVVHGLEPPQILGAGRAGLDLREQVEMRAAHALEMVLSRGDGRCRGEEMRPRIGQGAREIGNSRLASGVGWRCETMPARVLGRAQLAHLGARARALARICAIGGELGRADHEPAVAGVCSGAISLSPATSASATERRIRSVKGAR
jgi:hypothetical protein